MEKKKVWAEMAIATDDTAHLIYSWRSDPTALKASLHTSLPDLASFCRDFHSNYFSCPDLTPFFVRDGEERVAFVYFRPYDCADTRPFIKGAEISIIVTPPKRRQGYGLNALTIASEVASQAGIHTLFAIIRPDNEASKRVFAKAGYTFLEHRTLSVDALEGRTSVDVDVFSLNVFPILLQPKVFLVAEVGSNWQVGTPDERRALASKHVHAAAEAGFDAVKFQTFRAEKVYAAGAGAVEYLAGHGITKDIHAVYKELEMAYEDLPFLAELAKGCGLAFMSTPFSVEDFDAVDPFVSYHKIASYEIAQPSLLAKAASSKKPVFVSTGASYPEEIAFAVSELRKSGCRDLTLLQCTAAYPARPDNMNLRSMLSLAKAYSVHVGLSDHSRDYVTAPLLAVAFGARVIEKHVTLDRSLPTPDSFFSIEPHEMKIFVEKVRLAEVMVGSGRKCVAKQEEELFSYAKRAVQAIRPIRAGEILQDGVNIAILRPGKNRKGAHPALYRQICGKVAQRGIAMGDGIQLGDCL